MFLFAPLYSKPMISPLETRRFSNSHTIILNSSLTSYFVFVVSKTLPDRRDVDSDSNEDMPGLEERRVGGDSDSDNSSMPDLTPRPDAGNSSSDSSHIPGLVPRYFIFLSNIQNF